MGDRVNRVYHRGVRSAGNIAALSDRVYSIENKKYAKDIKFIFNEDILWAGFLLCYINPLVGLKTVLKIV